MDNNGERKYNNTSLYNIDDEIDKILAEQRKLQNKETDFFSDEPIKENTDYRRESYGTREHRTKETHKSNRGSKTDNSRKEVKPTPKKVKNKKENNNKKGNSKIVTAVVIIVAVIFTLCVCTVIFFKGIPTKEDIKGVVYGTTEATETTVIQETLAVVTVSGENVTYNGEPIKSTKELDTILKDNGNVTLSLINNNAHPDVYNEVAKILNQYGGNFEMMHQNNTNPSIKATDSSEKAEETARN